MLIPSAVLPRFVPGAVAFLATVVSLPAANPIITDTCTADPTALVHDGKVYLYTGNDEAPPKHEGYIMNRWLCFSSSDMVHWEAHGSPLAVKDFAWADHDAWAGDVVEKGGKFYDYVPMSPKGGGGFAIGVAVADSPTGPFKDARGSALVTNNMTKATNISWDDIDPKAFVDTDGQAYLFWGNTKCYCAKLKPSMIELDGPIEVIDVPNYTEAPWVHKHGNLYYLSYASGFPEKEAYATSPSIHGPWTPRGLLSEGAPNSNTIHQAIVEFKGQSYFIYHNGMLPGDGGSFRRSVCVDYLYYNPDGTIKRIVQTTEGTSVPPLR